METSKKVRVTVNLQVDFEHNSVAQQMTAAMVWENGHFVAVIINFTTAAGGEEMLNALRELMDKINGVMNDPPVGCDPA